MKDMKIIKVKKPRYIGFKEHKILNDVHDRVEDATNVFATYCIKVKNDDPGDYGLLRDIKDALIKELHYRFAFLDNDGDAIFHKGDLKEYIMEMEERFLEAHNG